MADESNYQKLREVNALCYKEQAIWFLNSFWAQGPKIGENLAEAENIWKYNALCVELDKKGEEGNELDEFQASWFRLPPPPRARQPHVFPRLTLQEVCRLTVSWRRSRTRCR